MTNQERLAMIHSVVQRVQKDSLRAKVRKNKGKLKAASKKAVHDRCHKEVNDDINKLSSLDAFSESTMYSSEKEIRSFVDAHGFSDSYNEYRSASMNNDWD